MFSSSSSEPQEAVVPAAAEPDIQVNTVSHSAVCFFIFSFLFALQWSLLFLFFLEGKKKRDFKVFLSPFKASEDRLALIELESFMLQGSSKEKQGNHFQL